MIREVSGNRWLISDIPIYTFIGVPRAHLTTVNTIRFHAYHAKLNSAQ